MGDLMPTQIANIKEPGRYSDGRGGHGLVLVAEAGAQEDKLNKRWIHRVTVKNKNGGKGQSREPGLGTYPEVTLKKAREKAKANHDLARAGIDPVKEKRKKVEEEQPADAPVLFATVAERVYKAECAGKRESTIRKKRHLLDNHILPTLGDRLVDEIEMSDVLDMFADKWTTIPDTAGRAWSFTERVFDQCIVDGVIELGKNPVNRAVRRRLGKQSHQTKRTPSIPHHRLGWAMDRIRGVIHPKPVVTKLCLLFVFLTACRHVEARKMTWNELRWKQINTRADWGDGVDDRTNGGWEPVDWDEFKQGTTKTIVWIISKEHAKMNKPLCIPMPSECLDVLREARQFHEQWGSDLVFPSPYKGHGVLSDGTLGKMCNRLELGGSPHGGRSSFGSWCHDAEVPFVTKEIALAHELSPVVRAYTRTDVLEERSRLMEYYSQYLRGELPDDWKWGNANSALIKQVTELTEKIESLFEQVATMVDLLAAAEKRAKDAEERLAGKETFLARLKGEMQPTMSL